MHGYQHHVKWWSRWMLIVLQYNKVFFHCFMSPGEFLTRSILHLLVTKGQLSFVMTFAALSTESPFLKLVFKVPQHTCTVPCMFIQHFLLVGGGNNLSRWKHAFIWLFALGTYSCSWVTCKSSNHAWVVLRKWAKDVVFFAQTNDSSLRQ
jgi:hypothetical protein